MRAQFRLLSLLTLFLVLAPRPVFAQARIEGEVLNGTSRRPVANHPVRLMALRQGMKQIATATTDAEGRFAFSPEQTDASSFYLIQAEFQGVTYPAPVELDAPNRGAVMITVYEATNQAPDLRVETLRVLARAEGRNLRVQEEFTLLNPSQPPRAYANPEGTFRFQVPAEVREPKVAIRGMMNMPLPQGTVPGKSPGEFTIRYPLKPGPTVILVGYESDYAAAPAALEFRAPYPIDRAELYVFPSTLAVETTVFRSQGVDTVNGVHRFVAENLLPGARLEARLSGEAAQSAMEAASGDSEVKVQPNSMTRLALPLLGCMLLVLHWALGVRVAKEWPRWKERRPSSPARRQYGAKVEALLNSLADLDELFAARKIQEKNYWKERLELKAKLASILKKSPPSVLESYATRRSPR